MEQDALAAAAVAPAPVQCAALIQPVHYARASSLLKPFAAHPETTASIVELSIWIDNDDWAFKNYRGRKEWQTWRVNASKSWDNDTLETYVEQLQLGTELQQALLKGVRREAIEGDADIYTLRCGKSTEARVQLWKDIRQDEAIAVLFMATCPHIETLRIGTYMSQNSLLEQYLMYGNYGRIPHVLEKVKHVEFFTVYNKYDDERNYNEFEFIQFMQLVHRLPQLESVKIQGTTDEHLNFEFFVPRCGNMKRLEITHSDIGSDAFKTLVLIPQELDELIFLFGGRSSVQGGMSAIGMKPIRQALTAHSKTLTRLDLDFERAMHEADTGGRDYNHDDDEDEDDHKIIDRPLGWKRDDPVQREFWLQDKQASRANHSMEAEAETVTVQQGAEKLRGCSFANFAKLQHLRIGIKSLLGGVMHDWKNRQYPDDPVAKLPEGGPRLVDRLPPSLVSLAIYGYERGYCQDVDDQIDELLRERQTKLPLLEKVEGIETKIPSFEELYGNEADDENLWVEEERDWTWI